MNRPIHVGIFLFDGVDVLDRQPSLVEHLADQPRENIDMGTRRDLRNDSAVGPVRLGLSDHGLRQHTPIAGDQRGSAVVTRRFEAQDHSHFATGPLPHPRAMH